MFSHISLSFLKTTIVKSLHCQSQLSIYLGPVTGKLLCSLVVSCLLVFSCFLMSCITVFTCEEGIAYCNLCWLASGQNYILPALLGILRLSHLFSMEASDPYFLFSLKREFLTLFAYLLSVYKVKVSDDSLSCSFPPVVLYAQVCVLSPNPRVMGQLSVHAH